MLQAPRFIAIDDEQSHLKGLTQTLNQHGIACLSIHFPRSVAKVNPCPNVRVIFADLYLLSGLDIDRQSQFNVILELLTETIRPKGPYVMVLWTEHDEHAPELQQFLEERVEGVTKPFDICPLVKTEHLDTEGNVVDPDALMRKIEDITDSMPEIGALFDWENRVLGATGHTVSSILDLIPAGELSIRLDLLKRTLTTLGIAAVGSENVREDRFRAVNEALLPVLEDRIANLREDASKIDIWGKVVGDTVTEPLDRSVLARLNWMAHFAKLDQIVGQERGAAVRLVQSVREMFKDVFGIGEGEAAKNEFLCKDFDPNSGEHHWLLIQVQAACDYAQRHAGSIPCYLGLELPSLSRRNRTPPASLWESPEFDFNGTLRRLHVSARFPVTISHSEFQAGKPVYRLREQVLYDLTYKLHAHGGRPGLLSFR